MVDAPGGRAELAMPRWISSIATNSPAYRSTTAADSAGTELAPLTTATPAARAAASSAAMPHTKARASAMST